MFLGREKNNVAVQENALGTFFIHLNKQSMPISTAFDSAAVSLCCFQISDKIMLRS